MGDIENVAEAVKTRDRWRIRRCARYISRQQNHKTITGRLAVLMAGE